MFKTEQDGTDGTSFTEAEGQAHLFMCMTEHTRNSDGTCFFTIRGRTMVLHPQKRLVPPESGLCSVTALQMTEQTWPLPEPIRGFCSVVPSVPSQNVETRKVKFMTAEGRTWL
jgi:hypothetical protein